MQHSRRREEAPPDIEPIKKNPEGELHSNGPVLQGDGALGADPLFNARTQRPRARLIHPLIRHATSSLPSVVHVDTCTKPKLGDVLPQVLGRQASEQEVLEKELSFPRETGHYRPRAERKTKSRTCGSVTREIRTYTCPMAKTPSRQPMTRCLIDRACVLWIVSA